MEAISNLMEAGKQFEIAFIDIDRLKFVNDTLGHEDGNIYIQDTAAAISRVREPKLICRIGGDEFLIISEDSTDLAQQLEKVRTIFVKESCAYNRSFSFGTVNSVNYSGDISDMRPRRRHSYVSIQDTPQKTALQPHQKQKDANRKIRAKIYAALTDSGEEG